MLLRNLVATATFLALVCAALPISAQVSFQSSGLANELSANPTSLEFGPDGRLYVSQQNGTIYAYTIQRTGPNAYQVTATETITAVKTIPNHDDDGSSSTNTNRQVTGLMTAGTATHPVLYVTSSDPRIGAGPGGNDTGLDTNSGVLSKLTWNGSSWEIVHLVRGLPRSEENHSTNGMALDPMTNTLYVMSGGNTNMGGVSNNFAQTQEYALSAALLSVDLGTIEAMPTQVDGAGQAYKYDLPTLDDPTRDEDPDPGDPFGGNDGRNQAILVPGGPVQVYAPGFRNAFDVVLTQAGRLYTVDNGPNSGWGGVPVGEGTTTCTNERNEDGSSTYGDGLHYISGPGYYGGHPHPTRGNPESSGLYIYENNAGTWVLSEQYDWQTDFPTPPVPLGTGNSDECDYRQPGVDDAALAVISASTNGIAEYTASNFSGALQGDLLAASFNGNIYRFELNAAGDDLATPETALFSGFGGQPLDVTTQGDGEPFPGTVWAAVYGADSIVVFEPVDFTDCTGADDAMVDEDADGFDNADEIDNGTDPCSGGSKPDDNDGDLTSDLNDPDDDDDGLLDPDDPFAIDTDNGLTTPLPVRYPFYNADPGTGFFGLGFTGLMANGVTDWLDQFDETQLAAGGAAGLFTVEAVSAGDALAASNDQDNGFQFGVAVDTGSPVFSIQARLSSPFFQVGGSPSSPIDSQSYGLQIGTGDQSNFMGVVLDAQGGAGGINVVLEIADVPTSAQYDTTIVGDPLAAISVDLYLTVDPAALTVQPAVAIDYGPLIELGPPQTIPAGWLDPLDDRGLAVGVISTSVGSGVPFGATWDFIEATPGVAGSECVVDPDCDDGEVCTLEVCNAGLCESQPAASPTICEADDDLCTLDSCNGAGSCITDAPLVCPPLQQCIDGGCVPAPADGDNDGIDDASDPCPGDPRNRCYGAATVRLNAGTGAETDCLGDTWDADFGFNTGSTSTCDLPDGCPIAGLDALFGPGCDGHAATENLFQVERYDGGTDPELIYDFSLADGDYVVNVLLANSWTGSVNPGDRVFDVVVEGVLAHDDLDPVVAAGDSGVAVVRSALTNVNGGDGLQIEFLHVTQNPAVKAIEVLACTTTSPDDASSLRMSQQPGGAAMTWTPAPGAFHHDVVRGDLATLRAGDMTGSVGECLHDDLAGSAALAPSTPPTGEGWWYLVRGVNCRASGNWGHGRDAAIASSANGCP